MSAVTVMFMPVRLAALLFCFAVISLFAASGAIGWYFVWAYRHLEPYKSEGSRATIIAGTQGGLCTLIVSESIYGFISLLSNSKGPIRWYLWLSWITFFLGCIATAGTSLLIWVFRFGAHDCTTSSSGQVTCKDLEFALKIVFTVLAILGCSIQSYMPTVLRLVYSRFAAQEILAKKLEPEAGAEAEGETPQPVDRGYLYEAGASEMSTNPQAEADRLIKEPVVEV